MKDAYDPVDLKENTDVGHPNADSIQFVTVPGEDKVFLYLWNTESDEPVTSVVGFDAPGVEKLKDWLTNVDHEARQVEYNEYGGEE
jgi:hypothetical protein